MTLDEMKKIDYEAGLHYELTHYAVFLSSRAKDQTIGELKVSIDSLFPLDIKERVESLIGKESPKRKEYDSLDSQMKVLFELYGCKHDGHDNRFESILCGIKERSDEDSEGWD